MILAVPNPDLSGALPEFAQPLVELYNWLGLALLILAGIGLILSAIALVFSYFSGSRTGGVIAGIVAVVCAVILGVNAGDIINTFTGQGGGEEPAAAAAWTATPTA